MAGEYWRQISNSRFSRRQALRTAAGTSAAAMLLAACGGSETGGTGDKGKSSSSLLAQPVDDTKNAKRGGNLVTAGRTLTSLDPIGSSAIGINYLMYSTLWTKKAGYMQAYKGELTGDAFESWEVSPDKMTVTAKVTTKAHFVPRAPLNGRVVDANDIAYSWEKYKAVGALRSEVVNSISADAPVLSMTATDDRTLVIKLSQPDATLFGLLAQVRAGNFYVLPREAEKIDYRNTSIGSGPWMMKNWAPGQGAFLERNPGYHQNANGPDVPFLDEWHYPEMPDSGTALAQFIAGNVHVWTSYIAQEQVLATKSQAPELLMYADDPATTSMRVIMGHKAGSPFADERVRRATMMTFDKAGLPVDKRWDSAMWVDAPAGWWLDPKGKDFGPNSQWYKFDIAAAKQLLAAAGFPNGIDTVMNYPLGYNPGILHKIDVVLGLFGGGHGGPIRYKVNNVDYATAWSPQYRFIRGQIPDLALIQDVDTPEPTLYMYQRFHSKGGVFQGGDDTQDQILTKARAEFDEEKRRALVYEAQRHEGGAVHYPFSHGGANTFELNWPAVKNINVFRTDLSGVNPGVNFWLDQTLAPFNKKK
jgi:ABC-type transport system substrate-binding protein